jgi:hypothetical protein
MSVENLMIDFIREDDVDSLKNLVERNPDIRKEILRDRYLVSEASHLGNFDMVKYLVKLGAKATSYTIGQALCPVHRLDIIIYLIDNVKIELDIMELAYILNELELERNKDNYKKHMYIVKYFISRLEKPDPENEYGSEHESDDEFEWSRTGCLLILQRYLKYLEKEF